MNHLASDSYRPGCKFPDTWTGKWFQHGIDKPSIYLNETHIENKGDCVRTDGVNKFIVHDRLHCNLQQVQKWSEKLAGREKPSSDRTLKMYLSTTRAGHEASDASVGEEDYLEEKEKKAGEQKD
ncbi:hypothetical protein O3M35_008087 [Rhynocoris fuscipes]|uniref:DUF7044 domain-containing protein n=1 Tax=Rhynocoris fuscipes TaxID=488301 RepID=A0AAW1D501_9HEMI